MVAVHWRIAQSNIGTPGYEGLEYYMKSKGPHNFDRAWKIGKKMRELVNHAYIYCKASSRIYSVPIEVDLDSSEVVFLHEEGVVLDHSNIVYGFRHSDCEPYFGDAGVMRHKFYTYSDLSESYN
ncbi:hypothetical protein ACOX9X_18900 [Photobacterium leiognathi subsp. mandapamensis]|uniref:hypothetical protein n=1 Tax=Photobacterium leiognathi TaxID=553611 RepID=UPI003BF60AC2